MRLAVREWRKGGQAGETRIDRWLHDNPNATLDDIIDKFGCVRRKALEALDRRDSYWHGHDSYVEIECDEDDNFIGMQLADLSVMYRMYDGYGSSQLSPQLPRFNCLSRWVDELGAWHDRQAARLLRWMGRRRYANELAKRDMRPIPQPEI